MVLTPGKTHIAYHIQRFRWVACQLDHLCQLPTDRARRQALKQLPPTLPATYERILTRIEDENQGEQMKRLVRNSLQLIAGPIPYLSARMLCEAVSVSSDAVSLEEDEIIDGMEILRLCGSLVRMSNDGDQIEFTHYTVKEFLQITCLTHPQLSDYSVSDQEFYRYAAPLCLRYVSLENFGREELEDTDQEVENIIKRAVQRPFYEHAAISWPEYIHRTSDEVSEQCIDALESLFGQKKSAIFDSWAIELVRHCLSNEDGQFEFGPRTDFGYGQNGDDGYIVSITRSDFTPLHMAAALSLPNLCLRLIDQGADVNL